MAGTRATRSASRKSPASKTSTPRRPRTSSSVQTETVTPKPRLDTKTSPYFSKTEARVETERSSSLARDSKIGLASRTASKGWAARRDVKGKARAPPSDDDDEGPESDAQEATGMTETSEDDSSGSGGSEDDFDPTEEEVEDEELDSDHLDEDEGEEADEDEDDYRGKKGKRKSSDGGGRSWKKKARASDGSNRAKGKAVRMGSEEDDEEEVELEEGQEIAGRIYSAPKTGQVPPGRISRNTLNFLSNLLIPERNDREWFRSHEPAFRQAEKEWQAFVGLVQLQFHEADDQVPILPPKDIIHRIYRDIRFSSDKTPYKKSFSLSTSRGGRKGIWAGYHLAISPNNNSILASGIWMPGKNEVASIRHQILADPTRFRETIGAPKFVKLFGPPKPHPKGKRQNIFGHEDALKVAPKGVDKDHKDIDLLKLRSIAVVYRFTDEEVLAEDFQEHVGRIAAVLRPFVHMLNDFMTIPPSANADDG